MAEQSRRSYPRAIAAMIASSPGDPLAFAADLLKALPRGRAALRAELSAWHQTVRVWQCPQTVKALLEPFDPADYVDVERPSAATS